MFSGTMWVGLGSWLALPVVGAAGPRSPTWNEHAATTYVDDRETSWQKRLRAHRDHGTVCVSSHMQLPYAMARWILQQVLGETSITPTDKVMMDRVEERGIHWSKMIPFTPTSRAHLARRLRLMRRNRG